MKKILIVMSTLYNGGAEKSLVNLLNELPSDKYDVDLMLFKKKGIFLEQVPSYVNIIDAPIPLQRLYSSPTGAKGYLLRKVIGTLISNRREEKSEDRKGYRWHNYYSAAIPNVKKHYDVAIGYLCGEVLYFIDEKVDADKKIVFVHNDYRENELSKKYEEAHYENMDKIISISEKCVDIFKEEFPQYADKTFYLPNITSSVVIRARANETIPLEYRDGQTNILSIGRLNKQKGFDYAIDAAKLLKDRGLKFCWYVIGNGELEGELLSQIKKNKVEDCFVLLGVRTNPYPYIKNCDFIVQPSRFEGKSVVLDEAKILGKAIVATNYPTVGDQVNDGKEGIIVSMDPHGISEGIQRMIEDTSTRKEIELFLSKNEYGNQKDVDRYIDMIER